MGDVVGTGVAVATGVVVAGDVGGAIVETAVAAGAATVADGPGAIVAGSGGAVCAAEVAVAVGFAVEGGVWVGGMLSPLHAARKSATKPTPAAAATRRRLSSCTRMPVLIVARGLSMQGRVLVASGSQHPDHLLIQRLLCVEGGATDPERSLSNPSPPVW